MLGNVINIRALIFLEFFRKMLLNISQPFVRVNMVIVYISPTLRDKICSKIVTEINTKLNILFSK